MPGFYSRAGQRGNPAGATSSHGKAAASVPFGSFVCENSYVELNPFHRFSAPTCYHVFFAQNMVGQKPAYGPLLIVSGYADPAVRTGMTRRVVARICKQRDKLQFHQYQGSDFAAVLGAVPIKP